MTLQEQRALVQKALKNDQLKELFLGQGDYKWHNLKHIPANVATDIGAILENGLYKIYESGDKSVVENLVDTLYKMLNESPEAIWTVYQLVWHQFWNEKHGSTPFGFIDNAFLEKLRCSVESNRAALTACHELVGWNLENGLWEDIARLEVNLLKRYGENLL